MQPLPDKADGICSDLALQRTVTEQEPRKLPLSVENVAGFTAIRCSREALGTSTSDAHGH